MMIKHAAALVAALWCAGAQAQTALGTTLLQGCQSLARQSDRNKCLEEAVKVLAAQPAAAAAAAVAVREPSRKEAATARATAVLAEQAAFDSAIGVGLSYNDYGPYLQRFAIEVDRYRAGAHLPEEQEAARALQQAVDAYRDARDFWRADIDFYAKGSNSTSYFRGLPVRLAGVEAIADRYGIALGAADLLGIEPGVPRKTALTAIWRVADERVAKARAFIASGGDFADLLPPPEPAEDPVYAVAAPSSDASDELRGKFACRRMVLDGLAHPGSAIIGDYAGFAASAQPNGLLVVSGPLEWKSESDVPKKGRFDCKIKKNADGEWSLAGLWIG